MISPEKASLLNLAENCCSLHQGGEADVYLLCLDNGEKLCLKWYKHAFNQEIAERIQKVKDNGICKIREFGDYDEHPYLISDFVEGISSDYLQEMPAAIALKALRQIVSSLINAGKVSVHHGDLSPSNVIFTLKDSAEFQTVLIDWGISGPGALAFAAPERFQGKLPDEKSDIFSLGMLLFRWVAGENLVEASSFDEFASLSSKIECSRISEKLLHKGKLSLEEISALDSLWEATLGRDPEDRASDLEELDELLEIALEKISGGEVNLAGCVRTFFQTLVPMIRKVGQKVSEGLEKQDHPQFPYKKKTSQKSPKTLKIAILCGIGILAVVIGLLIAFGTETPDVDDTGKIFLNNSRNLEMDYEESSSVPTEPQESLSVRQLLNDLPLPSKE